MTSSQIRFPATWGPMLNLSTGKLIIDDATFMLVPDTGLTVLSGGIGRKAYANQTYPLDAIVGYENNFMAYMSILFADGKKLKLSIGSKSKKRELVNALEQKRAALFSAQGKPLPPLTSII